MFTISETIFMVSMGMCYFFGWQTYASVDSDIQPVDVQEVL